MTKEEYWVKNKTKLQLNERSYNAFEIGVKFCENNITELTQTNNNLLDVINNQDVKIANLEKQIEKMKSDVTKNIKWADQNKNNQMYCKLNSMINQWEIEK